MAGAHFDAPEVHRNPQRCECRPHMVMHANRRTAGHEQGVKLQPTLDKSGQLSRIITRNAEQYRLDAERLHLRHQRIAVRIRNFVWVKRLIERFEFVSGR